VLTGHLLLLASAGGGAPAAAAAPAAGGAAGGAAKKEEKKEEPSEEDEVRLGLLLGGCVPAEQQIICGRLWDAAGVCGVQCWAMLLAGAGPYTSPCWQPLITLPLTSACPPAGWWV
jgi:hypothetical protein